MLLKLTLTSVAAGFAATLSTGLGQTDQRTSRHTGSSEGLTGNISGNWANPFFLGWGGVGAGGEAW